MTAPTAYLTEHEEGDMLWLDLQEARTYCAEGEEPVSLYTAEQVRQAVAVERERTQRITDAFACGCRGVPSIEAAVRACAAAIRSTP